MDVGYIRYRARFLRLPLVEFMDRRSPAASRLGILRPSLLELEGKAFI